MTVSFVSGLAAWFTNSEAIPTPKMVLSVVLAGARAFYLSLYLWVAIFMFNSVFEDAEEMLGFGILGSAALYGLAWFHLEQFGHGSADQD
jgi:hypothetical protein